MLNEGFSAILKQAKSLQENMQRFREKLEEMRVAIDVGAGMLKVIANGQGQILSIKIEQSCINKKDLPILESLLVSAINEAKRKAEVKAQKFLRELTTKFPLSQIINELSEVDEAIE
ncbi:MAG: YbaB/EbfC family nucleoid-associated protein [bacterium]